MKILIFEGISCSGKSTLQSSLREVEGSEIHKYLTIDRFIHSCYVFEKIKGATLYTSLDEMYTKLRGLDISVVYVDIPAFTAYERLVARGRRAYNNQEFTVNQFELQRKYFEESLVKYKFPTIKIDGTIPPYQNALTILKEIK